VNSCNLVKVQIATNDAKAVLTGEGGDPYIIFRNRPALLPEFLANSRVMKRRIQIDQKNARSRDQQLQHPSETLLLVRSRQTVSILTNDYGWKVMVRFEDEEFRNRLIAAEER